MTTPTPQQIAASLLEQGTFIVLDTETTGLKDTHEVVEVGAVDSDGDTVIDCLVIPTRPIPAEVTEIHGITNQMVCDTGVLWGVLVEQLHELKGRPVVAYNASFDLDLIAQSETFHHWATFGADPFPSEIDYLATETLCLMQLATHHFASRLEWDGTRNRLERLSLKRACELAGIEYPDNAHRAIPDCLVTLELLKFIAGDVSQGAE